MHIKCLLTNYNQWLCSKVHSNYLCSIQFKTIHIRQGDRIERLTKTFILQLHYRGRSKYFGYFHVQHYSYLPVLVWLIVISMQQLIMIFNPSVIFGQLFHSGKSITLLNLLKTISDASLFGWWTATTGDWFQQASWKWRCQQLNNKWSNASTNLELR